jgi:hypothetical protein
MVMPRERATVLALLVLGLLVSVTACKAPPGVINEVDDAARWAATAVEKLALPKSAASSMEEWLKVTKTKTGMSFEGIVGKLDELRPTVVAKPPIQAAADAFATVNRVPSTEKKFVQDVFIGTMCDTASSIAQGKVVDPEAIVSSAIDSAAGSLNGVIEVILLRTELEQNVREFARAKTADEANGIATDMSLTLECFFLGKVAG